MGSSEFDAVEREMEPKLAAFQDRILQNERLFARVAAVYESREKAGLAPEQKRLSWRTYTTFTRAGARLDAAGKKRVAAINERLAVLYTAFKQNVLADEDGRFLLLDKEDDLAGLPGSQRSAASHRRTWSRGRISTASCSSGTCVGAAAARDSVAESLGKL